MPEFTAGVVGSVAETPATRVPGVTGEVNPPTTGQPVQPVVDTQAQQVPQPRPTETGDGQGWTAEQVREFQSKKDREVAQWRRQAEQAQSQIREQQRQAIATQEGEYANQLYQWALQQNYDPGQSWPWAQQMARQEFAKIEQQQQDMIDAQAYRDQQQRSQQNSTVYQRVKAQVDAVVQEYGVDFDTLAQAAGDLDYHDPNFQLRLSRIASSLSAQRGVQALHQQATSTLSHTAFPGVAGAQGGVVIPDQFPKRRRFSKEHADDLAKWRKQLYGE